MRHPTWDDIRRFCEVDGWTPTQLTRERKRRDHDRFQKALGDGRILRTRSSHGRAEIGDPALFTRILRHQLAVTAEEFWDAVDNRIPPQRSQEDATRSEEASPAHRLEDWLAVQLAITVGLSDAEIGQLTQEAGMQIWTEWVTRNPQGGEEHPG